MFQKSDILKKAVSERWCMDIRMLILISLIVLFTIVTLVETNNGIQFDISGMTLAQVTLVKILEL